MGYQNGRLPDSALRSTVIGGRLEKTAATDADSMALAFASTFYRSLVATDTYRTYSQQVAVKAAKGKWAATPGTSNHGWGKAVDFASNVNNDASKEHRWLEQNAGRYGFVNPAWASNSNPNDGQYEPWHWEHVRRAQKGARHKINRPRGKSLGLGSKGAEVRRLQEDLNKIYAGKGIELVVDGDYGMATYALVRRFQRARGYKIKNGVVGAWTKRAISKAVKK